MARILAFSGSTRRDSFNSRLVKIAASGAQQAGATVTLIDLADYPMPLFDQDLEQDEGLPGNARKLKELMMAQDGFLIASPEYNSAFTPLLKNVIDWVSRAESDNEPPLAAYRGKLAAIMATSPGPLGGIRGLVFLRMLLNNLGITVIPEQQSIPKAHGAFKGDGSLSDETRQQAVVALGHKLATTVGKLAT